MSEIDRILIAGGGPVGLTAALSLAEYGIPFTLLEAADEIFEDPRAGTIHPPRRRDHVRPTPGAEFSSSSRGAP